MYKDIIVAIELLLMINSVPTLNIVLCFSTVWYVYNRYINKYDIGTIDVLVVAKIVIQHIIHSEF